MSIKKVISGYRVPIKVWTDDIAENAVQQLINVAEMPFIHKHIAAMPDVHLGKGATIGSVIPTVGAIIPAAVGVDLGCGMIAGRLNLKANELPDNLSEIRSELERLIPHGRTDDGGPGDWGAWHDIPHEVENAWIYVDKNKPSMKEGLQEIVARHPKLGQKHVNSVNHLGTLGTGNHFVELCLDENDDVWLMLHSGSRGIGNRIGTYFIELAKNEMRRWFINLPDEDLAYLPEGSEYFKDYVDALRWASGFAFINRQIMFDRGVQALQNKLLHFAAKSAQLTAERINCHHNYLAIENHFDKKVYVTRKGAIRAGLNELGIIPGSMGTGSYIVRGKGNSESFESCSHGAGRRMSRGEARKKFKIEDLVEQTKGVECRKDSGVIDEIPMAYKPISEVMANSEDLVEVVHTLRQIVNVKG